MARLGDVCEILDSKRVPVTAADRQPGPYPYYGANGVQDYVADYIFDDELVLLAEDGGNFGSKDKPIAYRVSGKCWVNNHAHVLKPKQGLDVDYLCYSLMFYDVSGLVNGATRQKLTQADMRKMEIPLPPLEEQRRIATLLDKVSDLIAKRRAQLDKLDLLVKARFMEMFGDPNLTNQIWDMSIFGNEFSVTSGGTPSTTEPTYWEEGTIPWIGSNMCQDTILYGNDGKFITKSGLEHSSAKVFPSGTVLVALVGATIGKTALLRFNTATNQNIAAIDVLSNKRFYPEFIFYELQMLYEKFQELGSGKFKMANQGFVRGLPTICPPLELQKEFAVLVELIQKSKLTIQQSLDKLETLKKALMQQYFGRGSADEKHWETI